MLRRSATQANLTDTIVSMWWLFFIQVPNVLASSTTTSHYQHLSLSKSSWIIGVLFIAAQFLLCFNLFDSSGTYNSSWKWRDFRLGSCRVYPEEIIVVFFLCATLVCLNQVFPSLQGEVCFIIGHNYTHMGSECEGFSLCLLGQTIVYCHVYTHIGNSLWEVLNLLQFS